jgi:phage-related protein
MRTRETRGWGANKTGAPESRRSAPRWEGQLVSYAKTGIARAHRRIAWIGPTAATIAAFSVEAKLKLGTALRIAQEGSHSPAAKAMKGALREVTEVVAPCDDGIYGLMYTARLGEVIYVLHAFKKKGHHGIATPSRELKLVGERLGIAKAIARKA